jgi:uncharacterized protein YukE
MLTVELLRGIRLDMSDLKTGINDLRGDMRTELTAVRVDLGGRLDIIARQQIRSTTAIIEMKDEITDMKGEIIDMKGEITGLNRRIDNVLIGPIGSAVREHGSQLHDVRQRVTRLEDAPANE